MKRKGLSFTRQATQSQQLLTILVPRIFCRDLVRQTLVRSAMAGSLKPVWMFYHWYIIANMKYVFILVLESFHIKSVEPKEDWIVYNHLKLKSLSSDQYGIVKFYATRPPEWSQKTKTTLALVAVRVSTGCRLFRCCVRDPGRWSHCILELSWYSRQPQKPHGWIHFYLRKQDE